MSFKIPKKLPQEWIEEIERNGSVGSIIHGLKVVARDERGTIVHVSNDSFKILHNGQNSSTFGNTHIGPGGYQENDYIMASIYTCPVAGALISISVYIGATVTGNLKVAIWRGSDKVLVVGSDAVVAVSNAWNTVNLSASLTNQTYWLGVITDFNVLMSKRYDGGDSNQYTYDAMPFSSAWHNPLTSDGYQNNAVSIYATYTVSVPTVTTQAVTNIEEITATGNGNITVIEGLATKRGVCWNTTGNPTVSDSKAEEIGSFGTGAFTESMTNLSPGTLYYVRAYGYNLIGYGYGNEVTFTTKPNPPTSLASTAKTKNSISLSWSKGSGAVTTMIRYRTDQYPTGPTDGTQGYSDTGSSGTVGSLSSGQIYYFRAWSYNSASPSPGYSDDYSSVIEYTRPDDPSSLACTVIDAHEIDLSWSKGTGGDKVMIRRKIGSYPTSTSDGDQVYFDTGTSYNNTGLVGGVHYYYRAWAFDTDSGYYSDSYSQDDDTTTTSTLPTGKIFMIDNDNNLFRINFSTMIEEKALSIT